MYTFTIHKQVVEWGTLYHIMESNGNGYIRAYVYNDQPTILYLSDLSVSSNSRKQGLATTLLDFTSTIHDYNRVVLAVEKDSWQYKWYKRLGFTYYAKHENKQLVWLSKLTFRNKGLQEQVKHAHYIYYTKLTIERFEEALDWHMNEHQAYLIGWIAEKIGECWESIKNKK